MPPDKSGAPAPHKEEPAATDTAPTTAETNGSGTPCIPELPPGVDNLTAALAYAAAGLYVLPVRRGTKDPGSVVGKHWQDKSSRDPKVIAAWFAGTDHDIAIHCGRSGLVMLDVDKPDLVPDGWWQHLDTAPYQSSRPDVRRRGHYPFAMPPGRTIGNPAHPWGEVRGCNGVIIAEPSFHKDGGHYKWERAGPVPALHDDIAEKLPDASPAEDAATDAQVAAFLTEHTRSTNPGVMRPLVTALRNNFANGKSRHLSTVSALTGALKETPSACTRRGWPSK